MSDREIYQLSIDNLQNLSILYDFEKDSDYNYYVKNLKDLRKKLKSLSVIPFLDEDFKRLEDIGFFLSNEDTSFFNSADYTKLNGVVHRISVGLHYFVRHFEKNNRLNDEYSLTIKLPELNSFSDLSRISTDFKKALEIPLLDSKLDSDLKIITAEKGSIWLYVTIGTTVGVSLIGSITWAAAVIKRRRAEAKIFESHTRTLDLKNDMMEMYIDAQKKMLEKVLHDEAEAIATKSYSEVTPETIERLKLSISTVSDLIDRGAKILPTSNSDDVKELFPNFKGLSMIESAIKKIS